MKINTQPLNVAIIGSGNRTTKVYYPLFNSIKEYINIVAVCDPNKNSCTDLSNKLNVKAYFSIKELVKDNIIDAALVICPVDLHYPLSIFLSENKIHHLIETSMCSTLEQAKLMVQKAEDEKIIMRVAENFFRFPFDRIAKEINKTKYIGDVKRIVCYHDHTGYHNNSRWIKFYDEHPVSVQCIEHIMETMPFNSMPHRFHKNEKFSSRFICFPENKIVVDQAANIKGMLGRLGRPGITSIEGSRGSISRWTTKNWFGDSEVRYCSDDSLKNGAIADKIFPIVNTAVNNCWTESYVDLPFGKVSFVNKHIHEGEENVKYTSPGTKKIIRDYYGSAVMSAIVDFVETVNGQIESEYSDIDAMMAMMTECAAKESSINSGKIVNLPITNQLESDNLIIDDLTNKNGVSPMDVEAIIDVSVVRP
jgi:hypothetical protein|tara:strand:+ start:527 stop:1789 length:1263 start_codon:yes stop_codon:yes gene_type:complete